MSALLIDEPPLVILPGLAVTVGLNEAIVLQQLHYWLQRCENEHDGRRWVYNTVPEWQAQFPFWSEPTIKRTFASLISQGLVTRITNPHNGTDRTAWHTVDYAALDQRSNGTDQIDPMAGSKRSNGTGQIDLLSNSSETPAETSPERARPRKRAREDRNKAPDGFPDELRPHAKIVLKLLREVAADHNAKEVTKLALGRAMMKQPRKAFVKEAYALASWSVDSRPIRDVVATYARWLEKEPDLAAIERLDESGHPVNGNGNGMNGIRRNPNTVPAGAFREAARRMTAQDGIQ